MIIFLSVVAILFMTLWLWVDRNYTLLIREYETLKKEHDDLQTKIRELL